jgi:hypothetical protein
MYLFLFIYFSIWVFFIAHYHHVSSFTEHHIHIYNTCYVTWVTLESRQHNSGVDQTPFPVFIQSGFILLFCFFFIHMSYFPHVSFCAIMFFFIHMSYFPHVHPYALLCVSSFYMSYFRMLYYVFLHSSVTFFACTFMRYFVFPHL